MSSSQRIVVLTGAGISAESGIRTFRDQGGLWEDHRIEDVATPEGYHRDPGLVLRFYNDRRRQLLAQGLAPNAGHEALARLEKEHRGEFFLVTQNVDNLHERAGTRNLVHMHGELLKMRCTHCSAVFPVEGDITLEDVCERCTRRGTLRPDIVWFGEIPFEMDLIQSRLAGCDLFISIGTSGNVYPAAGFVQIARLAGARTVELNLEPSLSRSHFQQQRYGKATEIVPAFVEELLSA